MDPRIGSDVQLTDLKNTQVYLKRQNTTRGSKIPNRDRIDVPFSPTQPGHNKGHNPPSSSTRLIETPAGKQKKETKNNQSKEKKKSLVVTVPGDKIPPFNTKSNATLLEFFPSRLRSTNSLSPRPPKFGTDVLIRPASP
ncbi:hypothetical protein Taro_054832 [Colocasia esculenta]|uniref:Uncharacterized protein n=1 Tax=Colocasia esculenta TaxID=4460 RepID=A0A843XSF1_COLES|nr:hypothetical protein [Colocasia esculenta]